jgi:hypothetical protein
MANRVEFVKTAPEHGSSITAYTAWLETQQLGRVEQIDLEDGTPRYWLAWEHRANVAVGDGAWPIPFATRTEAGDKLLNLYRQRRPKPRLAVTDLARQAPLEFCREWVEDKANHCAEPADFILWGKLFPPEALGPRCHDHAYEHAPGAFRGTQGQWAIFDLRGLYRRSKEPIHGR